MAALTLKALIALHCFKHLLFNGFKPEMLYACHCASRVKGSLIIDSDWPLTDIWEAVAVAK